MASREESTRTLSRLTDDARAPGAGAEDYLSLVIQANRPLASPLRFSLAAFDEIEVGRGAARRVAPEGRRLELAADDPWMSSSHARLFRFRDRWVLEDAGSKNGSVLRGRAVTREPLEDGDVIELGQTFFLFRSAQGSAGGPPILDVKERADGLPGLTTLSPSLEREIARLAAVAPSDVPVIVHGETGTGKELAARALHALSGRRGSFVAINCGALPAALVEGQLFGHRRGAFSGATEDHPGLIRAADGGTLLLDEIAELPPPAQAALLRVLQEREVLPIGATRPVPVDVRVVAATHRPLERLVEEGAFRQDLHARLAGLVLRLPPLRERREDLGLLVRAILGRAAVGRHGDASGIALHPGAARRLVGHSFPGNVRELERSLGAALALSGGGVITAAHLPDDLREKPSPVTPPPAAEDPRREELAALLREHQGNVSAVARALGKARMQIQRWLKRYGLDPEDFRGGT